MALPLVVVSPTPVLKINGLRSASGVGYFRGTLIMAVVLLYIFSFLVDVFWIGGAVILVQKYDWNPWTVLLGLIIASLSFPTQFLSKL